jgi:Flp pilus assembly protein TadB
VVIGNRGKERRKSHLTGLILNTVLLIVFDIILAIIAVRNMNIRERLYSTLESLDERYTERRLASEVKKYTRSITVKMSLVERIELSLIDKSNIRHYFPFVNFYTLVLLMILIFIVVLKIIYGVLMFVPNADVISFLFSLIPLFILDLMTRYNSEVVRKRLAEFISVLNRWCSLKEDIFYAFEKSIASGIGEPLKTFIRDMVIQVNRGIEPADALDILQMKVDNAQFRDFIINIKQNIKHRGDIIKLLTNLENQFYKIEEEYNRRNISTYKDRMLIYFIMFAVLFIAYFFIRLNPQIEQFYISTFQGKTLLTVFSIIYAGGFYMSFGITRFKH